MRRLLYFTAFIAALNFFRFGLSDPDLGWHLLGGAWISSHGTVPRADFINSFNDSWTDYHWLSQIIFYQIYKLGGYTALRVFFAALIAGLFTTILDIIFISSRNRISVLLAALIFVIAGSFIALVSTVRPQTISLLVIALCVKRLIQLPRPYEAPCFLAASIFLANVHVYWVFIPTLWFIYRVVPDLLRPKHRSARRHIGVFVMLCLSGFASPYFIDNVLVLFDYATMSDKLGGRISELQGALRWGGRIQLFLLAFIVFAVRALRRRTFAADASNLISAAFSLGLSLMSVKFVGIFAVMGIPFAARHGSRQLQSIAPGLKEKDRLFSSAALYPIAALALFYLFQAAGSSQQEMNSSLLADFPLRACADLTDMKLTPSLGRSHVRVLTHFNYGGWCRFAIYLKDPNLDYRVTTDGRTQNASADLIKSSMDLFVLEPGWQETLASWAPDAAVVYKKFALNEMISTLPKWRLEPGEGDEPYRVFVRLP